MTDRPFTTHAHYLTCPCGASTLDMKTKGVQECECRELMLTQSYKPHPCGCKGKTITKHTVTYGGKTYEV